jgi:hypothetical protein
MHRAAFVALMILGTSTLACQREEPFMHPSSGIPIARVKVVEGECRAGAAMVSAPEHCAWPSRLALAPILSVEVQVVSQVRVNGSLEAVRVVGGPPGHDFDEAAVACARRATYRAQADESGAPSAGETCPVTLRLSRYATDLDARNQDRPCPLVRTAWGPQGHTPGPNVTTTLCMP